MQSNLLKKPNSKIKPGERTADALMNIGKMLTNSRLPLPWGPITRQRLLRTTLLYGCVYLLALLLIQYSDSARLHAFATGLLMPGTGFLYWANPATATYPWFIGMWGLAATVFAVGMVLWFATGNIIAPVLSWFATAVAAALVTEFIPPFVVAHVWPMAGQIALVSTPLLIVLAVVAKAERAEKDSASYQRYCENNPLPENNTYPEINPLPSNSPSVQSNTPPALPTTPKPVIESLQTNTNSELTVSDLQKMRALLDRSLQPVDQFAGFDKLDQFQTAALRYQINFVSYALSVASQVHLPAARAYMKTAQQNLAEKLLDPRVWGYWQLENMWGNFSTNPDPIPRDNIMLSGFLAAQFGLARRLVSMTDYDGTNELVFKTKSGKQFSYSLTQVCEQLKSQYQRAPYGLLACEPNWVFPLCNAITALGMRTLDVQHGTSQWEEISDRFRHSLDTEFTSPGGLLVPFRSSRTGIAAPLIGGGAMQSFPCLFLNSLLPDVAARQWQLSRENLTEANGRSALWPVDIGNYRFNRSASYAACAAVAVEMGDSDTAQRLLNFLDEDCSLLVNEGVAHRPRCSLWSHALEFMAIAGDANALREATNSPHRSGPVITEASYPEVLIASARSDNECLRSVLYPGVSNGIKPLTVGGLKPNQSYRVESDMSFDIVADRKGEVSLELLLTGRTELTVKPIV